MFQQPDETCSLSLLRAIRVVGLGLILGATVLSSVGCARSPQNGLDAYAIDTNSFQMPSSTLFLAP